MNYLFFIEICIYEFFEAWQNTSGILLGWVGEFTGVICVFWASHSGQTHSRCECCKSCSRLSLAFLSGNIELLLVLSFSKQVVLKGLTAL